MSCKMQQKLKSISPTEQRDFVKATVLETVTQVLGQTELPSLDAPLQELGIDSLGAVEFRNTLQAKLGVRLPATTLFDYPTTNAIVGYLVYNRYKAPAL